RRLMAWPVVAAALAASYGLVQLLGLDPFPWSDASLINTFVRPFGPLGHPNFLAAYLVLALPLALVFLGDAWRRRRVALAVLLGFVVGLCLLIILATLSRAAWLGLAGVGAVLLLGWRAQTLSGRAWLGLLAGGAVLVLLVALTGLAEPIVSRLGGLL